MARNLVYYLFSGGAARVVALLVVPVYIDVLGIEAFGLIGFYLLLVNSAQLVELGIGISLARQIAQLRSSIAPASATLWLTTRVGLRYGTIVLALAVIIFGPLRFLLSGHVHADTITRETISEMIALMGIAITGHLFINYMVNALLGLEQHLIVSVVRFIQVGALQIAGVVAVTLAPSVETYFVTQVIGLASLFFLTLFILSIYLQKLPRGDPSQAEPPTLGRELTTGVAAVTLLGFLFSQIDRILVSGAATLADFGYYSLAFSVVNALNVLVSPTFNVLLPIFSQQGRHGPNALWPLYRNGYRITLSLVVPAIAVLIFIPTPGLWAWTGDRDLARTCAPLVQLLSIGVLAQALTNPSWLVQLGLGNTRAEVFIHLALVCVTPFAVLAGLKYWGLAGAALATASAHIIHLIASSLYVNQVFFGRQPVLEGTLSFLWFLLLPAALATQLPTQNLDRLESALIIVATFLPTALVGMLTAMHRLRKVVRVNTSGQT